MNAPTRRSSATSANVDRPAMKPWWRMPLAPEPAIGGALDPAAPRALWRLIHIGEMAGLIGPGGQARMLAAFRPGAAGVPQAQFEVGRFQCTLTDLYTLVTLFAAAPRPVSVPILVRETLADAHSLRASLDHLENLRAIELESPANDDPGLLLTEGGSRLAVLLMYRVITAAL